MPSHVEQTQDYQDLYASDETRSLHGAVNVVAGNGPSVTTEVRDLLRKRLKFVGLLGTCVYFMFTCFLIASLITGPSTPARGYGILFGVTVFMLVISAAACLILWSKRPVSLGLLRLIECTAFGLVLAHISMARYSDFAQYGLQETLRAGPPTAPPRYATFYSTPFFALIVTYGMLIPNTWKRATIVVGAMAMLPIGLAVLAGNDMGLLSPEYVRSMLAPSTLILAVGSALAVYSSHRINVLRTESFMARKFGQYNLRRQLGAGGMGEVYLAEHALIRRPCVIKLIRPDRANDPDSLCRFEREVQATAALTSWHTVDIFDYGQTVDGVFYYVMEYLPGHNLEQLVQFEGPLLPKRAILILSQICAALTEAHAIGLIHRDIKPRNIVVGTRGGQPDVAKLLDFGLVGSRTNQLFGQSLTQEFAITGTPAYLAPEQAAGNKDLDGRCDLYSLGAVGYFLLTGQPPFVRDSAMETIAAHMKDPVVSLDQLRPGIPIDLQETILRCLEKNPQNRYQNAEEMSLALKTCLARL